MRQLRKGVNDMRNYGWMRLGLALPVIAAALAAFFTATPAALAATCPPPPSIVTPFLPWGDTNDYVPVTDGNFEPIAKGSLLLPWTLSKSNASIVSDNEPWNVDGSNGTHALSLQTGGQATSACTTSPNIVSVVRFFVKNTGASTGQLHVQVLVNGGKNGTLDGGYITAGSSWQPTSILYVPWANPLKGAVDLQIVLTPVGAGASFSVDDVYFDPCVSRIR
jgi:hypothetical protein